MRDQIISLSYKGLEPLDENCFPDILGRYWDIRPLKELDGGDLLVDGLVDEQYPPYLSNKNKAELEFINQKFLEIKGRKPFEVV